MDGIDFEKRLKVMFGDLGYKVKRTPPSGNYGADLVLKPKTPQSLAGLSFLMEPMVGIEPTTCSLRV
jgi:hypothetical protein